MTENQRFAQALLDNPATFGVMSGNEIRICQGIVDFELSSTCFCEEDYSSRQEYEAARSNEAAFRSLLITFSKEISQWTSEPSDKP